MISRGRAETRYDYKEDKQNIEWRKNNELNLGRDNNENTVEE